MNDFRFFNPDWGHALWLILALGVTLIWLERRGGSALDRLLSKDMQDRLVRRLPKMRRWLSKGLVVLSCLFFVIAIMRPQWGLSYQSTPRVGAQIMVCLDVSKSMLAEDTAPNRLERAKAELSDLLNYLKGDQVGLIAFAGTATVMCPLTPDFGFFKLILDSASPYSVGRGGTRLEEPIRKALDGFRTESDISRALLLITDGEDHDSFPLEAAKEAAERGIRILAIGFGDETGSEIQISDPKTGVRHTLHDLNGNPVQTRLDGDTLREMALITEGAYIPAGTGALDLQSIYHAHIAPLMRGQIDDRGRAIRYEAFQWALLLGVILLISSAVVGNQSFQRQISEESFASPIQAAVLIVLMLCIPTSSAAQTNNPDLSKINSNESANTSSDQPAEKSLDAKDNFEEGDPRELYNQALAMLNSDFDKAEKLLMAAGRNAAADGEVRFRAMYNMGWVDVNRADTILREKPVDALLHFRQAADRFREAVRLKPDHRDARHNLEIVMRRILELADSLNKKEKGDLAGQLEELIRRQRVMLEHVRDLIQQISSIDDVHAVDQFRKEFRASAVKQRQIISDSQAFAQTVREELDTLQAKNAEELKPEENIRIVQLNNLLYYHQKAVQRMGQARSQMRRKQGQRSYRRSSAALAELKRARDQLRNPVEVLGSILGDAISLARYTSILAATSDTQPGEMTQDVSPPAWITIEYLEQTQTSVTERTTELSSRLKAGLAHEGKEGAEPPHNPFPDPSDKSQSSSGEDPQTKDFLESVRRAMPFITKGEESFQLAGSEISADRISEATDRQFEAIVALQDAREQFLDLRGLIELTYTDEVRVQTVISADDSSQPETLEIDFISRAFELQKKNLFRVPRLNELLEKELTRLTSEEKLNSAESPSSAPNSIDDQENIRRQKIDKAQNYLEQAASEMRLVEKTLKVNEENQGTDSSEEKTSEEVSSNLPIARSAVNSAVEHLEKLRRLFFSVTEHLRDTAKRQTELNDSTEKVHVLSDEAEKSTQVGPLTARQKELEGISGRIASTLQKQSQQHPSPTDGQLPPDEAHQQQAEEISRQLAEASSLVQNAQSLMQKAGTFMSSQGLDLSKARPQQDQALEKLLEALAVLVPPEQQQKKQQQQQQNQEQQEKQQKQKNDDKKKPADPARILQAVRDREAQRRKDKATREQASQIESVEKDW